MNNKDLYAKIEAATAAQHGKVSFAHDIQNRVATIQYYQQEPFKAMLTGAIRTTMRDYHLGDVQHSVQVIYNGALMWVDALHLNEIAELDIEDIKSRCDLSKPLKEGYVNIYAADEEHSRPHAMHVWSSAKQAKNFVFKNGHKAIATGVPIYYKEDDESDSK